MLTLTPSLCVICLWYKRRSCRGSPQLLPLRLTHRFMYSTGKPERERTEGVSQQVCSSDTCTSVHERMLWLCGHRSIRSSCSPQNLGQSGPAGATKRQARRVPEEAQCLDADQLLLSLSKIWPGGPDSAVLPSLCRIPQVDCRSVYVMGGKEFAVSIPPNAVTRISVAQGQFACSVGIFNSFTTQFTYALALPFNC